MLKPLAKQVGTAQQHGETTADRAEAVVLSAQHGRERSGLPKRARLRVWVGAGRGGSTGRTCVGERSCANPNACRAAWRPLACHSVRWPLHAADHSAPMALLRGLQGEHVDVFTQLGNEEPDDRQTLARQLLYHELHGGFAQGSMLEPYRVPQQLPEGLLAVSFGQSAGLLPSEGGAASSPAHQRLTKQLRPAE